MNSIRRASALLLAFVVLVALSAGMGDGEESGSQVLAPGASLEQVFGAGSFTEGPAMGPDGCVYFSDLTWQSDGRREDGHIWKYDPHSGECSIFRSPSSMSNGIAFDACGAMLVCVGSDFGGRGILRTDMRSGRTEILVSEFNGGLLNSPNDLVIDRRGRVYFTDPRYGDQTSAIQPVKGVYRLEPGGSIELLVDSISMPNGIALSPDEHTLYVGCFDEDRQSMALWAFDLDSTGTVSHGRKIVRFAPDAGPDGMTVDSQGWLYVAIRDERHPRIGVYGPRGEPLDSLSLPEVPSNAAFGRAPADSVLYITAGQSLYRIVTVRHGFFHPETGEKRK